MNELELETAINIQKSGYEFLDKPIIVGGLAMAKLDQLVKEEQNETDSAPYLFYIGRNQVNGEDQI